MDYAAGYLTTLMFYFRHNKSFLDFMEEYIQNSIANFDKEFTIDEHLEETNPEFYYFLIDDLSERWWQYSRDFPAEFRASILVQIYNGIDAHLDKICSKFHKVHEPPEPYKDFRGSELARKGKYLQKYAKVDFKIINDDWQYLENVRCIRNQIVHHHSKISSAEKDWATVKKFIQDNPTLIEFKDDISEKDEDGEFLYKKYPNHSFQFMLKNPSLIYNLLEKSERLFKNLIPQIPFKKTI